MDSLRGLAALGVAFFWHYQHFITIDSAPFRSIGYWLYHFGWNLVDLFFVLSGFIFTYVYMEKIKERRISFTEYGLLRFSRLYPLHLLTLLVVTLLQVFRSIEFGNFFIYQNNDIYHFLLNVFFMQDGWVEYGFSFNAPTWSLSAEVVAYILFFVILFKFPKRYSLFFALLIVVGLLIAKMKLNVPLLNDSMSRVFIGFFIGCCTFKINKLLVSKRAKRIIKYSSLFILVIVTFIGICIGHIAFGNWPIVYTLLIYPSIIIFVLNSELFTRVLSIPPLTYLGALSYSIYLWHFPVQLTIKTLDDFFKLNLDYSTRLVYISFVFLTLLVSVLSYEFFEKPALMFLRNKIKQSSLIM